MFVLFIVLAVVSAAVAARSGAVTVTDELYLRSPSGRLVDASRLRALFPDDDPDTLTSRLFELENGERKALRSHTQSVRLPDGDVSVRKEIRRDFRTKIVVDGREMPRWNVAALLHVGTRESYVTLDDGTAIAVYAAGLRLIPVDYRQHPNLFVNYGPISTPAHAGNRTTVAAGLLTAPQERQQQQQDAAAMPIAGRQAASCVNKFPKREIELAVDFDSSFCEQSGGDYNTALTNALALVTAMQAPYTAATCVQFKLTRVEGFCARTSDPYSVSVASNDEGAILDNFRIYRNENGKDDNDDERDLAFLITGFMAPDGPPRGIGYVGVACSDGNGYACSEPMPRLLAHELGHNLNAESASEGLMAEDYDGDEMLPFSQQSIKQICDYIDSLSESCAANLGGVPSPTPTTTPSVTPTPSVTASPTPSSDPSPPAFAKSCAASFSSPRAKLAMSCAKARLSGRVARAVVVQRFGRIDVRVAITGRPLNIGIRLSTDPSDEPASVRREPASRKSLRVSVQLEKLAMPRRSSTCCAKKIFVLISATVRKGAAAMIYNIRKPFVFQCENVCGRAGGSSSVGTVLHSSSSRRCPKCQFS